MSSATRDPRERSESVKPLYATTPSDAVAIPPKEKSTLVRRSDLWILLAVALMATFTFLSSSTHYHASFGAKTIEASTGWRTFLHMRYSGGAALIAREAGSSLHAEVNLEPGRYRVVTRLFVEERREAADALIEVSLGEHRRQIEAGPDDTGTGLVALPWELELQDRTSSISLRVVHAGSAIVFDHITIYQLDGANRSTWLRFVTWLLTSLLALLGLLILLRMLAGRIGHVVPSSGKSFAFLDGARGIAVMLVVALHGRAYAQMPDFADVPFLPLYRVIAFGHVGVSIFFVLSSFTLYYGLQSTVDRSGTAETLKYFRNRALRIFPAYYLALFACLALRAWLIPSAPPVGLLDVLSNATLAQVVDPTLLRVIINHSVWWSISTEVQFYLVLPGILLLMRRFPRLVLLTGLGIGFAADQMIGPKVSWYAYSVLNYLDTFLLGCFAASQFLQPSQRLLRDTDQKALLWSAVAIVLHLLTADIGQLGLGQPVASAHHTLTTYAISRVVLYAMLCTERGWAKRSMSGPIWGVLGKLAYGIYLFHVPVYYVVQRAVGRWYTGDPTIDYLVILFPAATMLTVLLAFLSYRYFELPILQWGRRYETNHFVSRLTLGTSAIIVVTGICIGVIVLAEAR